MHRRRKGDMSTEPAEVFGDLVAGLLDARDSPASDRFDDELARAVAAGELSADRARRLKAWQSAAVDEVADHVRTVLPATLDALVAARVRAAQRVQAIAAAETPEAAVRPSPAQGHPGTPDDTPEPASDTLPPPDSSLESRPARELVADLVVTRSPATITPN